MQSVFIIVSKVNRLGHGSSSEEIALATSYDDKLYPAFKSRKEAESFIYDNKIICCSILELPIWI